MDPRIEGTGPEPSGNGTALLTREPPAEPRSVLRRVLGLTLSALVIAGLAGAAYYGHHTGWTFSNTAHPGEGGSRPQVPEGLAVVRFGKSHQGAKLGTPPASLPQALRHGASLEFDSAEAVSAAGIDVAPAWRSAMTEAVSANGELGFDPARVARLSARVPGTAWRVLKATGDRVQAGEVMALIDAADVGKAKAEFQHALLQARLKRQSLESVKAAGQGVSAQRLREAEAAVREAEVRLLGAEQALANLGLPVKAGDVSTLGPDDVAERLRLLGVTAEVGDRAIPTANLLPVRSPFAGVVLEANVVAGEVAGSEKVLFTVVDPSELWLTLHVGPSDAPRVTIGQTVRFRPDGLSEEVLARLTWVGSAADETTRTIPVRAELPNPSGQLRAATFGKGRIVLREVKDALLVPREAVRRLNDIPLVFVRDPGFLKPGGVKAFYARPVTVGASEGEQTEIKAGLDPSEVVATRGSGLLLEELKRGMAAKQAGDPKPSEPEVRGKP